MPKISQMLLVRLGGVSTQPSHKVPLHTDLINQYLSPRDSQLGCMEVPIMHFEINLQVVQVQS